MSGCHSRRLFRHRKRNEHHLINFGSGSGSACVRARARLGLGLGLGRAPCPGPCHDRAVCRGRALGRGLCRALDRGLCRALGPYRHDCGCGRAPSYRAPVRPLLLRCAPASRLEARRLVRAARPGRSPAPRRLVLLRLVAAAVRQRPRLQDHPHSSRPPPERLLRQGAPRCFDSTRRGRSTPGPIADPQRQPSPPADPDMEVVEAPQPPDPEANPFV